MCTKEYFASEKHGLIKKYLIMMWALVNYHCEVLTD